MDQEQRPGGEPPRAGGAIGLAAERGDGGHGGAESAGGDHDGAAEGVPDEGDPPRAEPLEHGDAGEGVEDALGELAGAAVVEAQRAHPPRHEVAGEVGVHAAGGAVEAASRAAHPHHGAVGAFVGVEDAGDGSARRVDLDGEGAVGLRLAGDAADFEVEVAFGVGTC